MTGIIEDTASYEAWLGRFTDLHPTDLDYKHRRMADAADPFLFFRGTYYRWAQRWPEVCPELADAPRVLAVGDAHIENFGTWRDADGRLAWGFNDFDEADALPCTNDLARLACSVHFAGEAHALDIRPARACQAILDGYRGCLEHGGRPFVLEEHHAALRALAYAQERDPARFWKKLTKLLDEPKARPPSSAKSALVRLLPVKNLACEFRFRGRVGVGSLGKPRYVALAKWSGGWVAREAKAVTPPATAWLRGSSSSRSHMAAIVRAAVRSPDPFFRPEKRWLARRLAPRCSRIELAPLADAADRIELLEAMGAEIANVHLGSRSAVRAIRRDIARRKGDWLKDAARRMHEALRQDWEEWKSAGV